MNRDREFQKMQADSWYAAGYEKIDDEWVRPSSLDRLCEHMGWEPADTKPKTQTKVLDPITAAALDVIPSALAVYVENVTFPWATVRVTKRGVSPKRKRFARGYRDAGGKWVMLVDILPNDVEDSAALPEATLRRVMCAAEKLPYIMARTSATGDKLVDAIRSAVELVKNPDIVALARKKANDMVREAPAETDFFPGDIRQRKRNAIQAARREIAEEERQRGPLAVKSRRRVRNAG